ncbi:MAG TPA: T9SS type A sorting domain-containing protein, partial [Pedobacter sp.]
QNGNNFMRSATLKALAIGTAAEAGPAPGPDYSYGWGLLNMEAAAQAILDNGTKTKITENVLSQGEQQFIDVVASGNAPLTGTICWTDPEAAAISSLSGLNNTTPRLLNDLDLRAAQGTTIYRPWVLDPANPAAPAVPGDNTRDNVEQVLVANPTAGTTYRFSISHKGTLKRGPQAYSIILTGIDGNASFSSTKTAEDDSSVNLILFPVPANDELNVNFNVAQAANITVSLINLSGQVLAREEKNNFSGIYQSQFNTSALAGGVYLIAVKAGNRAYSKKFICSN